MATADTKRQSYTTAEKLKVIQFAEQHGNRTQREFDIAESNICLCFKALRYRSIRNFYYSKYTFCI